MDAGTFDSTGVIPDHRQMLEEAHARWYRLLYANTHHLDGLHKKSGTIEPEGKSARITMKQSNRALAHAQDLMTSIKQKIYQSNKSLHDGEHDDDAHEKERATRELYLVRDAKGRVLPLHLRESKKGRLPCEDASVTKGPYYQLAKHLESSHKCTLYDLRLRHNYDCDLLDCHVRGSSDVLQRHFDQNPLHRHSDGDESGQWHCGRCLKSYQTVKDLRAHLEKHHGMQYDCPWPDCRQSHQHHRDAVAHHAQHEMAAGTETQLHPLEHVCEITDITSEQFRCSCMRSEKSLNAAMISQHFRRHKGVYRCGIPSVPESAAEPESAAKPCHRDFKLLSQFVKHATGVHSKLFPCRGEDCPRGFKRIFTRSLHESKCKLKRKFPDPNQDAIDSLEGWDWPEAQYGAEEGILALQSTVGSSSSQSNVLDMSIHPTTSQFQSDGSRQLHSHHCKIGEDGELEPTTYFCNVTGHPSRSAPGMDRHIRKRGTFVCGFDAGSKFCHEEFQTRGEFRNHAIEQHGQWVTCRASGCDYGFKSVQARVEHERLRHDMSHKATNTNEEDG